MDVFPTSKVPNPRDASDSSFEQHCQSCWSLAHARTVQIRGTSDADFRPRTKLKLKLNDEHVVAVALEALGFLNSWPFDCPLRGTSILLTELRMDRPGYIFFPFSQFVGT